MPNTGDSAKSSGRVQQLLSGRRAGTVSLKQFKAQLEQLSTQELAELASAVLKTCPTTPERMEQEVLAHFDRLSKPA
jgi:hypothetical protein